MNVLLIGHGKMGQLIEKLAPENNICIAKIAKRTDSLTTSMLSGIDAIIDFSSPEHIMDRIKAALLLKVPMVVGTTGWEEHRAEVEKLVASNHGALIASANFSLGMALFSRLVKEASEVFSKFDHYDVSLFEQHHRQKKDHPSGTAKELAKILIDASQKKKTSVSNLTPGAIEKEALHIASLRCGHNPGEHQVFFDGPDDTITLSHTARSRNDFAKGALIAAKWIIGKKGFFTVDDLI